MSICKQLAAKSALLDLPFILLRRNSLSGLSQYSALSIVKKMGAVLTKKGCGLKFFALALCAQLNLIFGPVNL